MEVEKAKSNGFFKIFDWGSKKPKKRLFTSSPTSEKTTDRKDMVVPRLNLVEEDQITVISSIKGATSCSSSVTEEELITKKPTGVVARLMGLDSMPISTAPDPLSSPPFPPKLEASSSRMVVLRSHKMPSSPIERFQTETIPNKSSKMVPITNYKLLSPIKSSNNFISGRNADQIMEVASRIIDSNSNLNLSPFRVYDSGRYVRGNPKPVNRRLNIVQNGGDLKGEKGKRKVNLPVQNQPRVSAPKREISNPQRSSNEKKTVLVQNNRKQNSLGTRNCTIQRLNGERNNNNDNNNNAAFRKNKVSNNNKGNSNRPFENGDSKFVNRNNSRTKRLSTISEANHASTSTSTSNNNNNNHNNNNDILVKRSMRRVQHNIVLETQSRNISGNKKNGTNNSSNNIVSFTFTSPVDKFHKNINSTGTKKDLSVSSNESIIDGDYLGVLLEQKLRELTSGSGSPYRKSVQEGKNEKNKLEISSSFIDELVPVGENESVSSEMISTQENEKESIDEENSEQINDLSPMESCNSSESWESSKGGKSCTSILATKALDSFRFNEVLQIEDEETEFSESSSSITIITEMTSSQNTPELNFIKQILNSVTISGQKVVFENKGILESLQEEKDVRVSKKMLFGCVLEFLEIKCGYYFGAGYNLWFKGDLFAKRLCPEDLFKEVWVEKRVEEESMVDVLVDGDMSTQLGKWVDFEIEKFESGIEIEGEILGFLIDEFVGELVLFSN